MGHAGRHANKADDRRRSFLWHLSTFAWVIVLLAVIDVIAGDDWWVHWVAAIWGAILAVHFVDAFLLGGFLGFHACGPQTRAESRDQTASEGAQR
jgi:2TM domain